MIHTDWKICFASLPFVVKGQIFLFKKNVKENGKKKVKVGRIFFFLANCSTYSAFTKQKFYSYFLSPVAFIGTDYNMCYDKKNQREIGPYSEKKQRTTVDT